MFLQRNTIEDINIPHGRRLVYDDAGVIKSAIILDPKPPFLYFDKLLLTQLSRGTITQTEYNLRKNNENEARTIAVIDDLTVSNELLVELLEQQSLDSLAGENATVTIQNINSAGIQIII